MQKIKDLVTFAYSSVEATFLHLDVKPTQIVDVPGVRCCSAFAVGQME